MDRIRVASLCFVVALVVAPRPTHAQGPTSNINARVAALEAAVAALQANQATLQSNINAEATTRAADDSTLQTDINNEATTRAAADTALGARTAKLEGDITVADLVGTYRASGIFTDLDGGFPANVQIHSLSATVTLFGDGTGSIQQAGAFIKLIQGTPWTDQVGFHPPEEIAITWSYANGLVHFTDGTVNTDLNFSVGAGGRVLIYSGLSDDNSVDLVIATRLQ